MTFGPDALSRSPVGKPQTNAGARSAWHTHPAGQRLWLDKVTDEQYDPQGDRQ